MNNETSDSRGQRRRPEFRRAGILPAVVAAIALLLAACGGSSTPAPSAGGSNYQKALAFAQCMRSHGEPAYPDPTQEANNAVAFKVTGGIDTSSSQYQSAYKACQGLLPNGRMGVPPALLQKAMTALLKYSECMRSHGITNFPDPVSNGKGASIPPMSGVDPHSQQFQSAQQACRSFLPGGGGAA